MSEGLGQTHYDQVDEAASFAQQRALLGDSRQPTLDPTQQSGEDASEYSSDEDEEPLIIQLMESMFTRKKTVQESEQMISQINVEAIREEIRRLALKEREKKARLARDHAHTKTMANCERL